MVSMIRYAFSLRFTSMSYWIDFRIVSLSCVALLRIVSSRCLAWTPRYRNVKNPLTARVVMATHRMILDLMLLCHRTPSGTARVSFAGSGPATGEGGVGAVCILRHHSEAGRTASANGTAGARRSSFVCSIHSGGEKTSGPPLPGLRQDGIRPPPPSTRTAYPGGEGGPRR